MAYIESNFPPLKVWVRNEYLYQLNKGFGEFTEAKIVSVRCLAGQVVLFQVLMNNGVMRDKLPSHALLTKPETPDPDLSFDVLQIWNCFSYHFTVLQLAYLPGSRVSVFLKNKQWLDGKYFATINWSGESDTLDLTLAEDAAEHKSHHIILLDNGQIALQPNNRLRWFEPSFVTERFPERPDYLCNTETFNAEAHSKWQTENTDRYMYDTQTPT